MPGVLLSPAQMVTVLAALDVEPGVGSPLHSVAPAAALQDEDPELRGLHDAGVLIAAGDERRPNAAVGAALRACARPDEVLWFGADQADASITMCRRGRLFVDCSIRSDGRVLLTFPLDRAQLVLLATAALSGDRPEPTPSGFALRGSIADLFLLRAVADADARDPHARSFERAVIADAVTMLLDEPAQRVAVGAYAGIAAVRDVSHTGEALDEALIRLSTAGHLVATEPIGSEPARFRLAATTADIIGAPVTASFGVGRRRIDVEPGGGRRLSERRLHFERRGDRLVELDVRQAGGDASIRMIERTRVEIRALVGVFLLGDVWDRIASPSTVGGTGGE